MVKTTGEVQLDRTLRAFDAAKGSADRIDSLCKMVAAAPYATDERVRERWLAALSDEDVDVREAAVFCAAYLEWPEIREDLEQVAVADPDAEVRSGAKTMIEAKLANPRDPLRTGGKS